MEGVVLDPEFRNHCYARYAEFCGIGLGIHDSVSSDWLGSNQRIKANSKANKTMLYVLFIYFHFLPRKVNQTLQMFLNVSISKLLLPPRNIN